MRNFIFFAIAIFCFLSCTSELDEVKKQLDELERQAKELQQRKDSLENANRQLDEENAGTKEKIDDVEGELNKPALLSMEFLCSDNPFQIIEDAKCEIIEGNIVECWIPNIMTDMALIPRFTYRGTNVRIEGKNAESGVSAFNFRKPLTLTVYSSQQSVEYTVYVYSYTGLSVLWLETLNRDNIFVASRSYQASFKLVESTKTRAAGDVTEANVRIKGVGEMTKFQSQADGSLQMGKNSYNITFSRAYSLFDEVLNSDWDLISNASDNTMLRTQTVLYLGKISNLHYTPHFHFVELMFNMRYFGTYMLGESIDYSSARADVGLNGFILKIDPAATLNSFKTNRINQPISILFPTILGADGNEEFISSYLQTAENVLFSSYFTDANEGWQKYMDMDSFVDWYLINEIAKNEDAFKSECFMNMRRDGKLRMGPLWKTEKSFGYGNSSTSGFVVKDTEWYSRLFQDPAFVAKVKERSSYFYNHKSEIIEEIATNAEYLKYSAQENDNKWAVFDKASGATARTLYQQEVTSMKDWLGKRMDWVKSELDKL